MHHHDRVSANRPTRLRMALAGIATVVAAVALTGAAAAQERPEPALAVGDLLGGGARATVTESWGKLDFTVSNQSASERRARVLAFYANQPDVQYGRDLWVPAHAAIHSWLPLGPAPAQDRTTSRELRLLLYDLSAGKDDLVLPATDERVREFALIYRKRDPTTVLLADDPPDDGQFDGRLPRPDSPTEEALTLARVTRATRGLSPQVQFVLPDALPGWAKLFDGVDQLIIASSHVAQDPVGMRALRHWLEQGGSVWVMLDLVEPEVVAAMLGEALDFHLVGRVSLTDFSLDEPPAPGEPPTAGERQKHELPVTLARVVLPPGETSRNTVSGWPVWFTRNVGRGKVLFTTLGPRGWHRPRGPRDPRSPYQYYAALPVGGEMLALIVEASHGARTEAYPVEMLQSTLANEIGYEIVGAPVVAGVFAAFLVGTLGLSALARRRGRTQLAGWLGPIGALGAAGLLFALGQASRRAAPPAVALAQVVHTVDGSNESAVTGLLAVYRPDSGTVDLGGRAGGFFELDMAGLEGQTRRLIMTDMDAWHWENLALPAGVRFAPFQFTARATEPIAAVAHFTPAGLEGKVTTGPFRNPADALLSAGRSRKLALHMRSDGTFSATADDALAPGQFLADALLGDRQQQRQEIYRRVVKSASAPAQDRPLLLAWADPADTAFALPPEARIAGTALLGMPLRLERTPPGTRVTIPGLFTPVRRVLNGKSTAVTYESSQATTMDLRFQLPAVVLPFAPEQARLTAKINARARRIGVASPGDGGFVEHFHVEDPLEPIRVDLATARWVQPDPDGGIHVRLTIDNPRLGPDATGANPDADRVWTIEYIELEVTGRTSAP